LEATLDAGDCLFVPAYYYVQSRTLGDKDTIMLDHHFSPHSRVVEEMMNAIDTLTDDSVHPNDKQIKDYLGIKSWK